MFELVIGLAVAAIVLVLWARGSAFATTFLTLAVLGIAALLANMGAPSGMPMAVASATPVLWIPWLIWRIRAPY
jgi:hypothetical protein